MLPNFYLLTPLQTLWREMCRNKWEKRPVTSVRVFLLSRTTQVGKRTIIFTEFLSQAIITVSLKIAFGGVLYTDNLSLFHFFIFLC